MAYRCIKGGKECDGCGDCRSRKPEYCCECGIPIDDPDEIYEDERFRTLCLTCLKRLYRKY